MVVTVPPNRVENPMGIRTEDADVPVRMDTLINMGINNTTTGTLLMKALIKALTKSVKSMDIKGLSFQSRASTRTTGSSAPVLTIPWPAIIRANTTTSA